MEWSTVIKLTGFELQNTRRLPKTVASHVEM